MYLIYIYNLSYQENLKKIKYFLSDKTGKNLVYICWVMKIFVCGSGGNATFYSHAAG